MAIYFYTEQSSALLKAFDARIAQTEIKGKITTWIKTDGYYTHKATDWKYLAFFTPATENNRLRFNIIRPKDEKISITTYGYYHGHLIETFLNHFDKMFTTGSATALPSANDDVG